jgi:threonine dehydratase
MMTLDEFKKARALLDGVIAKTPLVPSAYFSDACGNNVYLKPENLQLTGSFKIRGAYYRISRLGDDERGRGIVAPSSGNHGLAVACAAQNYGVRAIIVLPTTTPLMHVDHVKQYGAEVVLAGTTLDEARDEAKKLAADRGLAYIPPYDDLDIAVGHGTMAFEILEDLPETDVILVPVGGGGLLAGVAALAKALKPDIQIIGVEPEGSACMKAALAAGHPVTIENAATIADAVGASTAGEHVFPYVKKYVDRIITIDDRELVDAFLDVMENHKLVVENAGLLTVAALNRLGMRDKNVVAVLSGGNMDLITMSSLIQYGLVNRGRVFEFSVMLPDRPGELLRVAEIISRERGNIIKLDHNQFVSIDRQSRVELRVTLEAFGIEHRNAILKALQDAGYGARLIPVKGVS